MKEGRSAARRTLSRFHHAACHAIYEGLSYLLRTVFLMRGALWDNNDVSLSLYQSSISVTAPRRNAHRQRKQAKSKSFVTCALRMAYTARTFSFSVHVWWCSFELNPYLVCIHHRNLNFVWRYLSRQHGLLML